MLTPYDEFPIHQTSGTFASLPSTDLTWDDGCYFGIFNADERLFLACGYRVNPNTDMIGGFAILNLAGRQRTVRFSRCWRQDMVTRIGPFSVEVVEPLRRLRIELADNGSGIAFAIDWAGVSPAVLEDHHDAQNRMRATTDQSRYCQAGAPTGFIALDERRWTVDPQDWHAARDHSWGLYAERRPLSPDPKWLPPKVPGGPQRSLRFWIIFRSEPFSGFYHLHEDAEGVRRHFDDVFGTPLGGAITRGWTGEQHEIVDASHRAEYLTGTKVLKAVTLTLIDAAGATWIQEFVAAGPPWMGQTSGYYPGGWKDGGNVHTYHGSETLALEWDEFDFRNQPLMHDGYGTDEGNFDGFGRGDIKGHPVQGNVYLCSVRTTAPDGSVSIGAAHVEHYFNGPYRPYGIE